MATLLVDEISDLRRRTNGHHQEHPNDLALLHLNETLGLLEVVAKDKIEQSPKNVRDEARKVVNEAVEASHEYPTEQLRVLMVNLALLVEGLANALADVEERLDNA